MINFDHPVVGRALVGVGLFLTVMATGCTTPEPETPEIPETNRSIAVRSSCPAAEDLDYFVPRGLIAPDELSVMELRRRTPEARDPLFLDVLRAAGLSSISCGLTVSETYRFIYSPPFRPAVVISVSRKTLGWTVQLVETEHPRKRPGLAVARRVTRQPAAPEVETFVRSLTGLDFWDLPVRGAPFGEGADPRQHVFEGRKGPRYHLVVRYPRPPGEQGITQLGYAFGALAGIPWPPPGE